MSELVGTSYDPNDASQLAFVCICMSHAMLSFLSFHTISSKLERSKFFDSAVVLHAVGPPSLFRQTCSCTHAMFTSNCWCGRA